MARTKLDGVIEAVHYTTGGKIAIVRAYERHGAVWTDRVLLDRKELSEQLKQGKHFVIGERKIYLGGIFRTGPAVRESEGNIFIEGQTRAGDVLTGVPVF
jgi:hypothetical protein